MVITEITDSTTIDEVGDDNKGGSLFTVVVLYNFVLKQKLVSPESLFFASDISGYNWLHKFISNWSEFIK